MNFKPRHNLSLRALSEDQLELFFDKVFEYGFLDKDSLYFVNDNQPGYLPIRDPASFDHPMGAVWYLIDEYGVQVGSEEMEAAVNAFLDGTMEDLGLVVIEDAVHGFEEFEHPVSVNVFVWVEKNEL